VAELLVKHFGKSRLVVDLRPDDFTALKNKMSRRWGPLRVADFIQHIRSVFKHAADSDLIDRPVRFGPGFARPTQKTIRLHKAKQGAKMFTAEEVRKMLDAAGIQLKAMLLLGVNCGYGNSDVASVPLSALSLESGWIDFPRAKTGIAGRCPLWRETIGALREVLANRPQAKTPEYANLVFLSQWGTPCISVRSPEGPDAPNVNRTDGLAVQMAKLLKELGINGRKGLGFYTLRHTFRTIADEAKDQPPIDHLMGHQSPHMSAVYRQHISDERLRAVVNHVHAWLFPPAKKAETQEHGAVAESDPEQV
jgi:integrase